MELEIEGEDGSKFPLEEEGHNHKPLFGRGFGFGFNTNDRTVSRHHVSFQLNNHSHSDSEPRVSFEVIGRNPIWVCTHKDPKITLFRRFDKGHLELGDRFCLSGKTPIWFSLKKRGFGSERNELDESSGHGLNVEEMDVSGIDPVKEFGFLVMGHEFDHYPKGMIWNVKDWEWYFEEPHKDSEDEEDVGKERREMKRMKRKKGEDNEDEEWTGESEDDEDVVAKMRKGKRPGYSTKSKDSKGPSRDTKNSKGPSRDTKGRRNSRKKETDDNETVEEEEDDDETLGGFIVDDEEDELGEENSEDEEEEFEDDDDDDDDDQD